MIHKLKIIIILVSVNFLLGNSACTSFATGALEAYNENSQAQRSSSSSTSSYKLNKNEGIVVATFSGCSYFIADGNRGLYVLEWFGGYSPYEGDLIYGDICSYGMKNVKYSNGRTGKVWVEDFWESKSAAMDEINDHC